LPDVRLRVSRLEAFKRDLSLLRDLLALVPRGGRTALALRHPSWHDDAVLATLSEVATSAVLARTLARLA
jgi:uncharacterized protein YecE (DUF72 family)